MHRRDTLSNNHHRSYNSNTMVHPPQTQTAQDHDQRRRSRARESRAHPAASRRHPPPLPDGGEP